MDRRQFLASGSVLAATTMLPATARAATTGDAALAALMDRIFWDDMRMSPMSLTSLGLDKGDWAAFRSRLDDNSPAAKALAEQHARDFLAETNSLPAQGLGAQWQVRRAVLIDMLETSLLSAPFPLDSVGQPYRLTQQDGAYFSIPDFLNSQHPVETRDDAEAYIARLAAFPHSLDQDTAFQRFQATKGFVAPPWSLDLVAIQIGALLEVSPEQSGMVNSLADRAKAKGIAGDWHGRATAIVRDSVFPALTRQLALVRELRGQSPAGDGAWRLAQGDEIYARALRLSTTTTLGADEIHQTGLQQVAELSAQLDTLLRSAGLTGGTVGERLTALNTRPDQLFPNDDEGRKALLASLNANVQTMTAKLPRAFATIPTQPLEIRRVPPEIQDGAPNGYYNPASLDGSRPAIYWINLKSTSDWPKYSLPSLTYHEGVPGHHLQLSILQQTKDLPLLLKNYFNSAYGEGWALYAEMLADELDGYTGLEKAGALQSWLFRAARLVVDTGIHAKRWSVERAAAYLVEQTGFTPARSLREIQRYCVSPGQACSYKIGQNTWVRLRKKAQDSLGARFDIRQFHEILQEGVMPLSLLEQQVDAWIAGQKG